MQRPGFLAAIAGAALLAATPPVAGAAVAQDSPPPPVQSAAPPPPVPRVLLTPAQVETVLRARGYEALEGLEREGEDTIRIASARRFGETVGPLLIDGVSGEVLEAPPLNEAQARRLLRDRGYAEVREIRPEGQSLRARALREGAEVTLRIDARTGVVRPWQE